MVKVQAYNIIREARPGVWPSIVARFLAENPGEWQAEDPTPLGINPFAAEFDNEGLVAAFDHWCNLSDAVERVAR
jgi:hypothetical protein